MLERCALRHGNVHSADGWRHVLDPVIARHAERDVMRFFRADAAYAIPAIYERMEEAGYFYTIRLPANAVLKDQIAHRLTPPVGRPRYAACLWGHIERRAPSFGLQKDNDIDVYIGLDVSPRL